MSESKHFSVFNASSSPHEPAASGFGGLIEATEQERIEVAPAKNVSEFLKIRYKLPPFLTSLPIRHYFYSNCILSYKYELTIQIN